MVRVQFHEKDNTTTMRIEGRFVGRYAEDVRSLLASKQISGKLIIDLSELSWADLIGEEVLCWLGSIGCKFVAGNAYSSFLCEKLRLRPAPMAAAK
jgi:hypothetical protein